MIQPSEKLLSTIREWYVLSKYGEPLSELHRDIRADIRDYWEGDGYTSGMNEHELMSLMKEWAISKGYDVDTSMTSGGCELELVGICPNSDEYGCRLYGTTHVTEIEAMTKSCEWILNEKES